MEQGQAEHALALLSRAVFPDPDNHLLFQVCFANRYPPVGADLGRLTRTFPGADSLLTP